MVCIIVLLDRAVLGHQENKLILLELTDFGTVLWQKKKLTYKKTKVCLYMNKLIRKSNHNSNKSNKIFKNKHRTNVLKALGRQPQNLTKGYMRPELI